MSASELLADLRQRGLTLVVNGDHLNVDAPKGALTYGLRWSITDHKRGLLAPRHAEALAVDGRQT